MSSAQPARRRTSALLIGILAVLAAVLLIVFVLRLSRRPGAKVDLGTPQYNVGKADRLARSIDHGGPLLFQALVGSHDIYLQHVGADVRQGWVAIEAHPAGQARSCVLRWQPGSRDFEDPCSHAVFPADGPGLVHYATTVTDDGHVVVDLRQPVG